MTSEQLFDSLQYLDDDLIEVGETHTKKRRFWLKWGCTAACLVLLAGAALYASHGRTKPAGYIEQPVSGGSEVNFQTERPIQPVGVPGTNAAMEPAPGMADPVPEILAWNDVEESPAQADWALEQGVIMVGEKLTKEQLAACMPEILLPWMENADGFATYLLHDGSGGLANVELQVTNPDWGGVSTVRIRDRDAWQMPECIVGMDEEEKVSAWNGLEYRAYRHRYDYGEGDPKENPPESWVELTVKFGKEDLEYTILSSVPCTEEQSAALDLRDLLLAYSGTHYVPDLSGFKCGEYRFRDEELTYAGALDDPDYGAYLPKTAPQGFDEGYFRRYQLGEAGKALSEDWLTAQWYKTGERGSLVWFAGPVTEEASARIVAPEEREKYDFSLYPATDWYYTVAPENRTAMEMPTFRAPELTQELVNARAHVDYDGAILLDFRVLFDDGVLLTVRSCGVAPEWVFEVLNEMK